MSARDPSPNPQSPRGTTSGTNHHALEALHTSNKRSLYVVDPTPDTHFPAVEQQMTANSTTDKLNPLRSALGLDAVTPIDPEHIAHPNSQLVWPRIRMVLREPFAEFWGVFVMIMFGNGSVAQVLLSEGSTGAPGGNGFGSYQSISWGLAAFSVFLRKLDADNNTDGAWVSCLESTSRVTAALTSTQL